MPYRIIADVVLLLHFCIVLFIVGGLVLVVVGNLRGWHWVNTLWLRLVHSGAIGIVILQSWLGEICPLTSLESWLRTRSGSTGYSLSFIEEWLSRLLYIDAPFWAFVAVYTAFGALVALAWWRYPPQRRRSAPGQRRGEQ